ncbi:nucleoporin complex subunit 54-domain-containing protein [Choanephora cucurbitarum]|nr:nucleoporin complex subunit 54-domain-containing protein [Choanephora cucurbitarum]
MASFGGFGSSAPSFGSTANTQTSAGTLFGGSAANTSTAPSNSLFGASNNTNAAGTLFGANANNSSAGTLFGASTTPASTGFGGFGSTPATSTASGGFGGFGATSSAPATTNSFGSTQPAAGFGGFGSTPATSTASTGFGGFGNTATSAPATSTAATGFGGFGTTPATSTATTGFGGFGATPATSTASTGFGGFGATPATSTVGGSGFGGFGTTPATSTATTGFGGFGNAAAKPAFGGFGATNTTNNSMFGANNQTTGFGGQPSTGFGLQQQQQQQQQQVQEKVWEELALIRARFDPTSANCYFRHYFYNMVPENEIHLYRRPENQTEQAWNEAMRKNPDPKKYVPVLAVGFDDILKRMEVQSKQVELHQEKLKETSERLQSVQRQYALGTLVKIEEHKRRHTDLTQRLLRVKYSSVLRYKGFPLNGEESTCVQQLAQLAESSESPEQLNAKMNALWNRLQSLKAQMSQGGDNRYEVWRTVSEEDTNIIAKILSDEQRGIKHITSILKSDEKDLEAIEAGLKERLRPDMST